MPAHKVQVVDFLLGQAQDSQFNVWVGILINQHPNGAVMASAECNSRNTLCAQYVHVCTCTVRV